MTSRAARDHAVELVEGQWSVWRDALIRSAGFPCDGLTEFSAPECAALGDVLIERAEGVDPGDADRFDRVLHTAVTATSARVGELSTLPLLREAVTWQNRSVLGTLDALAGSGPHPARTAKHRRRERAFLKYWQRYCGKAETVGFFGPVCWARIDPAVAGIEMIPGEGLARRRRLHFEHWALECFAQALVADERVRPWLAPRLHVHLSLQGRSVLQPFRPPVRLSHAHACLLARCDGRTSALAIAKAVLALPDSGLRSVDDVLLLLAEAVKHELVQWDFDLPVSYAAEEVLGARIAGIGDPAVRQAAESRWRSLCEARDRVAEAAGDADALGLALDELDRAFVTAAGEPPSRRAGHTYAGRSLCVEETTRALEVTVGRRVLDSLAAPLAVTLTVARWLCGEVARTYTAELERIYEDLEEEWAPDTVPLGQLWFLAKPLFYGTTGKRPVDSLVDELERRWNALFDIDGFDPSERRVHFDAADLEPRLPVLFPAAGAVWSGARIHSPDLMLIGCDAEDFEGGTFSSVLGELHTAWTALSSACLVEAHPSPDVLRAALRRDCGENRMNLLVPPGWPRQLPRLTSGLEIGEDPQLGFEPASGPDLERLVPLSALSVRRGENGLVAAAPDGRSWPILEVFARMLSDLTMDAFKLVAPRPHTPRITVDRMVVARETWRMRADECPPATASGEREWFLAARRWKRNLGLPDHVFVKLTTEIKPFHVDLSSPLSCSMLAACLRAARAADADAALTVSEMLPDPAAHWLTDADGRRYVAELRLHVRDEAIELVG